MRKKSQLKHAMPKETSPVVSFFIGFTQGILLETVLSALLLFALWLYALAPQTDRRFTRSALSEYDYAHRGLYNNQAGIPENSLPAFRLAAEYGFGVELDLQLTRDNQVAVYHDENLLRLCGEKKNVSELTLEELQEYTLSGTREVIPSFDETLSTIAGRIPLLIEIKAYNDAEQICPLVWEALKDYDGLYCIESFNFAVLEWFRKNQPQVIRGQLMTNVQAKDCSGGFQAFVVQNLCSNFLTRPDFTAYDCRARQSPAMWLAKSLFGMPEVSWTVQDRNTYQHLKAENCLVIFEGFYPGDGATIESGQKTKVVTSSALLAVE